MTTHVLRSAPLIAVVLGVLAIGTRAEAQTAHFDRLATDTLAAGIPSDRVAGAAGEMRVVGSSCESFPMSDVRRRIVDIAVQEWAFFGFAVVDRTQRSTRGRQPAVRLAPGTTQPAQRNRRRGRMSAEEFSRLAPSIAGFWATTPDGSWMLERQNDVASSPRGTTRWRDPWSAAFISWVMCEAGLSQNQFARSIAHRDYIDQAIRARDGRDSRSEFVAYDMGEAQINPGDLLCSGSRPDYRTIDARRRQMGDGARTHCDIVVKVDTARSQILTIGGNVGSTVSMKLFPAVRERGEHLHPRDDIFAHLKLGTDPIELFAIEGSPTVEAIACSVGFEPPAQLAAVDLPLSTNVC